MSSGSVEWWWCNARFTLSWALVTLVTWSHHLPLLWSQWPLAPAEVTGPHPPSDGGNTQPTVHVRVCGGGWWWTVCWWWCPPNCGLSTVAWSWAVPSQQPPLLLPARRESRDQAHTATRGWAPPSSTLPPCHVNWLLHLDTSIPHQEVYCQGSQGIEPLVHYNIINVS